MKLIDTSVVVDIDRGGVEERVDALDAEGRHAVSVVTLTELRLGVLKSHDPDGGSREEALTGLERLLARFDHLPVDRTTAGRAADVIDTLGRRGNPVNDLHDVYIGATALANQLPVLTANVTHFERIPELDVIDWSGYDAEPQPRD